MLNPDKSTERFISILADGKFHETVDKNTEGAVEREYETSDKKTGSKWELVYKDVSNVLITNVQFHTGDFGENLQLTLTEGDNEVVLSVSTASRFGENLLRKLPALDFSKVVAIKPYSFLDEKEKMVQGVNFYQNGDKVMSFFQDEDKKNLHGFPSPEGDTTSFDNDDWKIYFLQVRKFLVNYAKENIASKFSQEKTVSVPIHSKEEQIEIDGQDGIPVEINPEDIPF